MPLIYITGVSGSGKSAVQQGLNDRGYTAYDVDDHAISGVYELASGQLIKMPPVDQRTPEWFTNHSWRIKPGAVEKLKADAENQMVFLCGAARNDNNYGKSEHELQQILEWHKKATINYRLLGAVVIEADQPLDQVIDAIMQIVGKKFQ